MVMVIVSLLLGQDQRLWDWQAVKANSQGELTGIEDNRVPSSD
jgi:hypothetical protein